MIQFWPWNVLTRVLKERHLLLAVCLRQHGTAPSVPGWRRCGDVDLMSWVFHRQQKGKAFLTTLTFAFTNAGFCPHEWLQTPNQVLLVVTRMYPDGNFYHKYKNVMWKKQTRWCRNREKTTPQTTWKYNVWPTFASLTNVHRNLSGTYKGPQVAATSLSLLSLISQYTKPTDGGLLIYPSLQRLQQFSICIAFLEASPEVVGGQSGHSVSPHWPASLLPRSFISYQEGLWRLPKQDGHVFILQRHRKGSQCRPYPASYTTIITVEICS